MEQNNIHNSGRRIFFKNTLLGIGGSFALPSLPSFLRIKSPNQNQSLGMAQNTVYAVESGLLGKDKYFALGLLVVGSNGTAHESYLKNLRDDSTASYRTRLNYSSNDRFKIPFAQNALTYFNTNDEIRLYLKVISDFPVGLSPTEASVSKIEYYNKLFDKAGLSADTLIVNAKSQSPFGPSVHFKSLFADNTGGATLEANNTFDSNLLQLASFITGTIMLDIRGISKRGSVKRQLLLHLKSITNVETFKPDLVVGHDKIVII
jgi:hypothetical protein